MLYNHNAYMSVRTDSNVDGGVRYYLSVNQNKALVKQWEQTDGISKLRPD